MYMRLRDRTLEEVLNDQKAENGTRGFLYNWILRNSLRM